MAKAEQSIEIKATTKQCFDVITDFESYPDFLKETKGVKIEKKSGNTTEVTFTLELIKKFSYTLKMLAKPTTNLSWSFVKGEIMKDNKGEWVLEDLGGGKTKANYSVDVNLGMFVPGAISKMLIGSNLPAMMDAFKKRIEGKKK